MIIVQTPETESDNEESEPLGGGLASETQAGYESFQVDAKLQVLWSKKVIFRSS